MKLFISYSRRDESLLKELVPQLELVYPHDKIWYDTDIQGGADWWQTILSDIRNCSLFVFLMSDSSSSSDYCQQELEEAVKQDKAILPVLIAKLSIPYPEGLPKTLADALQTIQYVDLSDGLRNPTSIPRLWAAINQMNQSSHKAQRILLSRHDRWILSNQFEILAALYPDQEDTYRDMAEIVSSGYEWDYEAITEYIYDDRFTMRRDQCLEVVNILDMFSVIKSTYEGLADKTGIESWQVEFFGFDGNSETTYMAYTRFLVKRQGKFEWLFDDSQPRFNSHMPTLERYRAMLEAWKNCGGKYNLTKADLLRILSV